MKTAIRPIRFSKWQQFEVTNVYSNCSAQGQIMQEFFTVLDKNRSVGIFKLTSMQNRKENSKGRLDPGILQRGGGGGLRFLEEAGP